MNWIKCSERMPEEGKAVLVFVMNYSGNDVQVMTMRHSSGKSVEAFWNLSGIAAASGIGDNYGLMLTKQVTHWMPLPEKTE